MTILSILHAGVQAARCAQDWNYLPAYLKAWKYLTDLLKKGS